MMHKNGSKGDVKMVMIDGIKILLSQKKDAEIRMGIKQAEDMGLDISDKSIVELFKEGIAVDVIIKSVGKEDLLPKRLQRYLEIDDPDQIDRDNGFVKVKIVNVSQATSLNPLEVASLLLRTLPNDFKVAGYVTEDSPDGFTRIRVISTKKDRFLDLKEIRGLFGKMISPDSFEFLVDEI